MKGAVGLVNLAGRIVECDKTPDRTRKISVFQASAWRQNGAY